MPERWLNICRSVTGGASGNGFTGTTAPSYAANGASSLSLPASTNCTTATALNSLEIEPARNTLSGCASPNPAVLTTRGPSVRAIDIPRMPHCCISARTAVSSFSTTAE